VLAPFAALAIAPVTADAMPAYACAVHEVFECTAVSGFKRVRHQNAGIPPMVTLNVKEKGLFSGLFGGAKLLEKGDIFENEQVHILRGRKGLQTWTAVVEKPTGGHVGVDLASRAHIRAVRHMRTHKVKLAT
jgi:hypothetical protein